MRIGDIDLAPMADGTFRAGPGYFGDHVTARGHEELFDRDGKAFLPIGCFLVRTRDRTVLVDAGMGPAIRDDGDRRLLIGGQLPVALRAQGVAPADVDTVVCTHLHADHCGWLFDLDGAPTFPNADVWFGAGDWDHFVMDPAVWRFDHVRLGFRTLDGARLHLSVVVSSGSHRLAVDRRRRPGSAAQVRERLFRELEGENVVGAGAHFPELQFGRVLAGELRRWATA